jgi:uncharacterized protein with HEPN domain
MKDDSIFIEHILEAIDQIMDYTEGVNKEEFDTNRMRQDAVIRQIEIIGEAAKKISSTTTQKFPEIPWKQMAGMRDKLIHNYFGVDIGTVWLTVKNDIPLLQQQLKNLI